MTLPTEIQLPLEDNIDVEYMRTLIKRLEGMYEDMVQNINGDTVDFVPILKDTATDTTYTYTIQEGWYFRQGLLVDVWFHVTWTAIASGTPTGNLYVQLPYEVLNSSNMPFTGCVQSSVVDFGTDLTQIVINGIPTTFRGEFYGVGSGQTMANITANTAAGTLIGHIRYVGNEFEG